MTQRLGINRVFLGVLTVVALSIGLMTPPVGASLFITCDISKSNLMAAFRTSVPYLTGVFLALAVACTYRTCSSSDLCGGYA